MAIPLSRRVRAVLRRSPLRRFIVDLRHRGLNAEDVFLASYPRSGNTWLRSMISSCLLGNAMTNFNDKRNRELPIVGFHRRAIPLVGKSGRIIKTHEPYRPQYQRAIWVVRDPRDVLISEHRLALRNSHTDSGLEEYTSDFLGKAVYSMANWREHTISWLNCPLTDGREILRLRFEDLKTAPETQLKGILEFLGCVPTEELIQSALRQNSIKEVATRHATFDESIAKSGTTLIPAINSGRVGGWRDVLSEDSQRAIENSFGDVMAQLGYLT